MKHHYFLIGLELREDWTGDSKITDADKSGRNFLQKTTIDICFSENCVESILNIHRWVLSVQGK